MVEKPKMYFVCENQGPQWFYSHGVLSNGFHFGEHLCSAPGYAPGDLYFNRKERRQALEELFGFTWNVVVWLTLGVGPCQKAREAQDNIIQCLKARPQATPEECGKAFK